MGKLRVYELAKEVKMSSSEVVERLKSAGFPISNYMSSLDMDDVLRAKAYLSGAIDVILEERTIKQYFKRTDNELFQEPKEVERVKIAINEHIKGKTFVIDGLNICFAYLQTKGQISFEVLLSILKHIRQCGGSFKCMFDANTYYQLRDKGSPRAEDFYNKLLHALPNYFFKATGGISADDFILMDADKNRYPIITNDRFDDYAKKYPWIREEQERLIKGRLFGEDIMIPKLDINIPLRRDLKTMVDELIADLSARTKHSDEPSLDTHP